MQHPALNKTALLAAVLALCAPLLMTACSQKAQKARETEPAQQEKPANNVVGENVSFTITESDHKKWDLFAKRAVYFEDQSGARLSGVKGSVFNDSGKSVATFEAPEGEVYQQENKVVLTGGVVARSTEGDEVMMTAPRMVWSAKSDRVLADQGVRLVRKGMGESTAERCRFSLDFSQLALEGNALSKINF